MPTPGRKRSVTMKSSGTEPLLASLVEQLKFDIILGNLRPRERLIEDELSARLAASRHLIRSALSELEHLGFVTRQPNKGATVRDLSIRDAEELYEVRALLQAEAVRRIPVPPSADLIAKVTAIHERYCQAVDRYDLKEIFTINNEFHQTIFAASDNHYLADIIERLWIESLAIRCYAVGDPVLLQRSRDEHTQILSCLKSGDREELIRLTVAHIYPSLETYKRARGGYDMRVSDGSANLPHRRQDHSSEAAAASAVDSGQSNRKIQKTVRGRTSRRSAASLR